MQDWMPLWPVLRYCRIIATASKHGGVKFTDEDPTELGIYAVSLDNSASTRETLGRWRIRIDNHVVPAAVILEIAGSIWRDFFDEYLSAGD